MRIADSLADRSHVTQCIVDLSYVVLLLDPSPSIKMTMLVHSRSFHLNRKRSLRWDSKRFTSIATVDKF